MQDVKSSFLTRDKIQAPTLGVLSLSHWTTGKSLHLLFLWQNDIPNSLWETTILRSHIFVVQSLSCVPLFVTPWTAAACQASLSFTIFRNLLKLISIELVMPSNHLILCCPLLLLPSIFPSIKLFSNEFSLCIRWPKYLSFRFSISPSVNIQD